MSNFEFDPNKSQANLEKHGIDFIAAQALWDDPNLIEFEINTTDEPRNLIIGRITDKIWSAVITYRKDTIRSISVRRARKTEVMLYES